MGKVVKLDQSSSNTINHFSHEHSLKLMNIDPRVTNTTTCVACKGSVSGRAYVCSPCNYYIHEVCLKFPQTKRHEAREEHDLVLLSSPAYPEGVFKCNVCGCIGNGFSYHCWECELDIHPVCAYMPLLISNPSAHEHVLKLCFVPPYENKAFRCDLCHGHGLNHWLYVCIESCEFDAHLKCAKATRAQTRSITPGTTTQHPPFVHCQQHDTRDVTLLRSTSVPNPPPPQTPPQHNQYFQAQNSFPSYSGGSVHGQYYYDQVPVATQYAFPPVAPQPHRENSTRTDDLVNSAVEGLVGGAAQALFSGLLNS